MPATRFATVRQVLQLMAGTSSSLWSYRDARARLVRSTRLGSTSFESGDGKTISLANREDETSDGITTWSPDTWRRQTGAATSFKAVPMPREEPQHSGDGSTRQPAPMARLQPQPGAHHSSSQRRCRIGCKPLCKWLAIGHNRQDGLRARQHRDIHRKRRRIRKLRHIPSRRLVERPRR